LNSENNIWFETLHEGGKNKTSKQLQKSNITPNCFNHKVYDCIKMQAFFSVHTKT